MTEAAPNAPEGDPVTVRLAGAIREGDRRAGSELFSRHFDDLYGFFRNKVHSGDAAEDRALAHLQAAGLRLVTRNYRTPGRGGGEIDLVMRAPDGTLVFVEVRQRASRSRSGH